MNDQAELHGKILGFLMGEWARKDNRQLVSVDLLYAPGSGYRDEEIRKWVRADEPDLFAEFVNIEKLVAQIIEIATGEADAKAPGKHRFIVRCTQHGGSRPTHSFALSPSYTGNDDVAIVPGATPETWSCGTTITNPFTPMGQCINPHSAFDAGAEGWNLDGGATVGDRLVTMPQGSSISQFVKAEPQTGAWANKLHSIIIGVEHKIHIAARISNPAMPNTAVVKIGAFQPGSQDVGTINPTSASAILRFLRATLK
jgi:hypothetical protein